MDSMLISRVECNVLLAPGAGGISTDTALDDVVVTVYTDQGVMGVGEVESNPWAIKALIDAPGEGVMNRGLGSLLIGQEVTQPSRAWDHLYRYSLLTGRRGAGICAIGALDIAIWDAYGKCLNEPVWKLLGGVPHPAIQPYASLLPHGATLAEYRKSLLTKIEFARDAGFRAVKAEILVSGPYAEPGLDEDDDAIVDLTADCRAALGPDRALMVDVGYCCSDWKQALRLTRRLEKHDLFFLETPLPPDDLEGYARLCEASELRIAAGELYQTRFEFEELMDRGKIDVVQPDVGRAGGITETVRIAHMAADRGKLVVPHCWKSTIGIAAAMQVAAVTPGCPFIEFLPAEVSESAIRRDLVMEQLVPERGLLRLPCGPGLGVTLNPAAFSLFRDEALRCADAWQAGDPNVIA